MKKFFLFLTLLTLGVGQMWGATANFSPTGAHTSEGNWSLTDGDITISWHGTDLSTDIRVYKGQTLTVTSSSGNISAISFTFSGSNNGGWSTSYTGLSTTEWSRTTSSGKSGKQAQITAMTVTYEGGASKTLSSIAITTQPTTKKYIVGDTFSKTGAIVMATYSDETEANVSNTTTWTPTTGLVEGSNTITASYTEGGVKKTATTTVTAYSVNVQKQDETGATITADGVSASASGRTLTASATDASKYVFKQWKFGTASGTSIASESSASTTLNGTPTDNVTVIAEFYKPITITYKANGSTFTTQTYAHGGTLAFPVSGPNGDTYSCTGKTFTGWVAEANKDYSHATTAPTYATAGGSVTAAATYYAVFAVSGGGGGTEYVLTAAGAITAGTYIIAAYDDANSKYVTLTGATSGSTNVDLANETTGVTLTNNKFTTAPTGACEFTLSGNASDGFTIKNADATGYLGYTAQGTSRRLAFGNSYSSYTWKVVELEKDGFPTGCYIHRDLTSNYTISTNGSSTTFIRGYSGSTKYKPMYFFKKTSNVNYSNYETNCCTPLDQINGSFFRSTLFVLLSPEKFKSKAQK